MAEPIYLVTDVRWLYIACAGAKGVNPTVMLLAKLTFIGGLPWASRGKYVELLVYGHVFRIECVISGIKGGY